MAGPAIEFEEREARIARDQAERVAALWQRPVLPDVEAAEAIGLPYSTWQLLKHRRRSTHVCDRPARLYACSGSSRLAGRESHVPWGGSVRKQPLPYYVPHEPVAAMVADILAANPKATSYYLVRGHTALRRFANMPHAYVVEQRRLHFTADGVCSTPDGLLMLLLRVHANIVSNDDGSWNLPAPHPSNYAFAEFGRINEADLLPANHLYRAA